MKGALEEYPSGAYKSKSKRWLETRLGLRFGR